MNGFRDALGIVDRPHFPAPGSPRRDDFKEWYHFNILDAKSGTDVLINLSFAGDVNRAGHSRVDVIALVHHQGWWGEIETYDVGAAQVHPNRLDVRIADAATLSYQEAEYRLRVCTPALDVEARLQPLAEPMLLWNDTPLGTGHLNWLIAPHLSADARLRLGDRHLSLEGACGYHDHNWGCWRWGDDFGWVWGFAAQMTQPYGRGRHCLVFDRTTDRMGATSHEHTLAIWSDQQLRKVFTRQSLRARRSGRYTGKVDLRPGAARLVVPGQILSVPAQLNVSAREDDDWLDLSYRVQAALQIAVPAESGFGVVGLNETFGTLDVQGVIQGQALDYSTRACFEFLG